LPGGVKYNKCYAMSNFEQEHVYSIYYLLIGNAHLGVASHGAIDRVVRNQS